MDATAIMPALAFGLPVVFVGGVGAIWIMDHLETNTMPQPIEARPM